MVRNFAPRSCACDDVDDDDDDDDNDDEWHFLCYRSFLKLISSNAKQQSQESQLLYMQHHVAYVPCNEVRICLTSSVHVTA